MAEISVTHDDLIDSHEKWAAAEKNSNAKAGERRQEIGAFAERVGVEGKALSQIRAGLKIKNDGKREDWLRSMEVMLPMAANHIRGQGSGDLPLEPEPIDFSEEPEGDAEFEATLADSTVADEKVVAMK